MRRLTSPASIAPVRHRYLALPAAGKMHSAELKSALRKRANHAEGFCIESHLISGYAESQLAKGHANARLHFGVSEPGRFSAPGGARRGVV